MKYTFGPVETYAHTVYSKCQSGFPVDPGRYVEILMDIILVSYSEHGHRIF